MIGFHAPGESDGRGFRWTTPLALIDAAVPQGAVEAELELLPARGPTPPPIRVTVDGRTVPPDRCTVTVHAVRFPIQGGDVRSIGVVSTGLRRAARESPTPATWAWPCGR